MQYAIELYFDEATEGELLRLSQRVAEEGLSTAFLAWKTRPHLTLACFNDVDEAACAARLRAFARRQPKLPAYLGTIGMFTDSRTIFASPVMNRGMYQLQAALHEQLKDFDARGWEWYLPDHWVPHCTLALTGEDGENVFYRASELLLREFRKTGGAFTAIGLVKITRPVQEICTVELQG